ncbi:MAG TPA: T9SS type A sorting domain-containing protein, partial [Spirochaetota bacterium]|nr:T9SS type A sorting domain-containing protein [Spirochaetota bacterium]
SIPVDTTIYNDGLLLFTVRISNDLGQTQTVAITNIADNSPPAVSIIQPSAAGSPLFDTFTLNGNVSDEHSGISSLHLFITNAAGNILCDQDISAGISGNTWSYTIDSKSDPGWTNGQYYMQLTAVNGVGFTNHSSNRAFNIYNLYFAPIAGPNPYKEREVTTDLLIQGLEWKSIVSIYSINGRLVKKYDDMQVEFQKSQNETGTITWDLNNGDDKKVAAGVYIMALQKNKQTEPEIIKISVVK